MNAGTRIHPTAIVHPGAQLGERVVVGPYALVGPDVQVGDGTVIEAFATLEGHTTVGAGSHIGTGAVLGSAPQDVQYEGEPTRLVVGDGVRIGPQATVSRGTVKGGGLTEIGAGCVLGYGAHVGHDCRVGQGVQLQALAALAGHVVVGEGASIGVLAGVHQFVRVGRLARIEPHSMVGKDVPPFVVAGGNPARMLGIHVQAFDRGALGEAASAAVRRALELLYEAGLTAEEAARRMEQELGQFQEVRELAAFVRQSGRGVMR